MTIRPSVRKVFALLFAIAAGAGALAWWTLVPASPAPMDWTPVFRGVEMRCEHATPGGPRLLALRLALDEPSLEIVLRPGDDGPGQYRLAMAGFERWRHGYQVLMNSALYQPARKWTSYPGRLVRTVDTIVINGRAEHLWEHSYLLWAGRDNTPHLETTKPPPQASIAAARWGIGVQGIQVGAGQPRPQAADQLDRVESRTFIGFHSGSRRLYLLAWESATPVEMMHDAIRLGVEWGGQLDSGSATHLLVERPGRAAGIASGRPLGPYLALRAAPLGVD